MFLIVLKMICIKPEFEIARENEVSSRYSIARHRCNAAAFERVETLYEWLDKESVPAKGHLYYESCFFFSLCL